MAKENFCARAQESGLFANRKWEAIKLECLALYDLSLAYHNDPSLDVNKKRKNRTQHLGNYTLHEYAILDFEKFYEKKSSTCR